MNTNGTMPGQFTGRVVQHEHFNDEGYTNNIALTKARMSNPDSLNPVITHLMGAESKKFPLLFLTEGQKGGTKYVEIQDVEYDWAVFGRLRKTDEVASHSYTVEGQAGANGTFIEVVYKTQWLKNQHTIISPKGFRCRIAGKPTRVGNGFLYRLQLLTVAPYLPLSEIAPNTKWAMSGGAQVSESYSMGNESNTQTPGKVKNQIGILRKSYEIAGNVSERTTVFEFNVNGKKTNYWLPFEEWQHEMSFKGDVEENLWESEYNRDASGRILTIDEELQLPIPMGAGVLEQIPNRETYGELTVKRIRNTVREIMYGATDTDNLDIVLFTGVGGKDVFSEALMQDANKWTVYNGALNSTITGGPRGLTYGAFFTQYRHIDGHTITVKDLPYLDFGGRAQVAEKHPVTGLPMTSYEMHFIDMSKYDGENNVQIVTQKGRALIRGVEQGMTLLKGLNYGDYKGNKMDINLATAQDKTSIHYLKTCGIAIRRNTHCFSLINDMS